MRQIIDAIPRHRVFIQFNFHVRLDADAVDALAAGRVISRSRHLHPAAIDKFQRALHNALAEGLRADKRARFIIADCARENFRRAGAVSVDQHDHRHIVVFVVDLFLGHVAVLVFHRYDNAGR